jgi:hypothetical protein
MLKIQYKQCHYSMYYSIAHAILYYSMYYRKAHANHVYSRLNKFVLVYQGMNWYVAISKKYV